MASEENPSIGPRPACRILSATRRSYYARIFRNGKESWKSLKIDLWEVAKANLQTFIDVSEKVAAAEKHQARGRMTREGLRPIFTQCVENGCSLRGHGKMLRKIHRKLAFPMIAGPREVQRPHQNTLSSHRVCFICIITIYDKSSLIISFSLLLSPEVLP